ncbi:hypothetical protein V8V91_17585 [Algoriphagus halophilus]|uniref:hypothetical protein n=1 Tax=Algoriphagus halophilus TaxID=226505 RepID=UPI00358DEE0C
MFELSQETTDALYAEGISLGIEIALRIFSALLFYFVAKFIAKKILAGLKRFLDKRDDAPSLNEFLYGFSKILLYAVVFVGVLMILGVPGSSFLAIFGAAGLAIGLALQGSLSNFAGAY